MIIKTKYGYRKVVKEGLVDMPYSRARYGTRKQYAKYQRCIKRVKKKGGVRSPYAVCQKSVYGRK